jgi:hypothetical protein
MKWLERFKPHKGDVYRPGQVLPEPGYETATGRKLYTVQQIRAAYAQGQRDSVDLLRRARNLLSQPPGWVDTPSNSESRYTLSVEISEHLNGLELSEAWTENQKRLSALKGKQ